MNENASFFLDLFLELAHVNGRTEYPCGGCQRLAVTDESPSRYNVQTIKEMMRAFYA